MRLTLAENFRALFYAPFYALKAGDFCSREGLHVEWLDSDTPGGAIEAVKSGAIDLSWGGPMRVLKDRDSHPAGGGSLLSFGEVVSRDPFCLVGRHGRFGDGARSFALSDLTDLRMAIVSEVPTPWLCLQADLRDAGVDVSALSGENIIDDLTMPRQLQALEEGSVDVVQLFEPYVSEALAAGARLLYAAADRGPTVYTTFICSQEGLQRHRPAFLALLRALHAMQKWMVDAGPDALADTVAPFFPELSPAVLRAGIRRYHACGLWARHPEVSRAGFARLSESLHGSGFISAALPYESCVHVFGESS